jgi:Zn-finger nucleic acid-binding protein
MSDKQGIEIDYCPQCRGVWLDRGELDKIIERSAPEFNSGLTGKIDNYRGDHHGKHHDNHDGHHRKKSLLQVLFD